MFGNGCSDDVDFWEAADVDGNFSSVTGVTGVVDDAATLEGEHWLEGGVSLRGGILSLIASRPFASANEVILWLGEKPCSAIILTEYLSLNYGYYKNYNTNYFTIF